MDRIPVLRSEELLSPSRTAALRDAAWQEMVEKVVVLYRVQYPSPIEGQVFELEFPSRLDES